MRALYRALGTAAGISILAACTGGQSGIEPPAKVDNTVQTSRVLQFRVGTARLATGAVGLNTLTTFRQANGFSGTLYNTPTITGPAGFLVPAAGSAGTDAGTNHISGTPPTQPGTTAVVTTFNQSGGVFAYGFANANSTTSGSANYAQFFGPPNPANSALYADDISTIIVSPSGDKGNTVNNIVGARQGFIGNAYLQPFYVVAQNKLPFLLGPPAVPNFHTGTFPAGFLGYDSGFTFFAATPVAGTYTLDVTVPSATIGINTATFTQPATLTSVAPLPAVVQPVITRVGVTPPTFTACPGCGGASFVVAPAAAGITNQVLYIVDVNSSTANPTMYSFAVPSTGGTFVLSPTSGPSLPSGGGDFPFKGGDSVYAYVVGADYDIVGLAPPTNVQQSPTLPAQADISVSTVNELAY